VAATPVRRMVDRPTMPRSAECLHTASGAGPRGNPAGLLLVAAALVWLIVEKLV